MIIIIIIIIIEVLNAVFVSQVSHYWLLTYINLWWFSYLSDYRLVTSADSKTNFISFVVGLL